MNKQIIMLAQEAGFMLVTGDAFDENAWFECFPDQIERFAELVAEQTHTNNKAKWYQEGYEAGQHDEREACAHLCDELDQVECATASRGATAIRARGEK